MDAGRLEYGERTQRARRRNVMGQSFSSTRVRTAGPWCSPAAGWPGSSPRPTSAVRWSGSAATAGRSGQPGAGVGRNQPAWLSAALRALTSGGGGGFGGRLGLTGGLCTGGRAQQRRTRRNDMGRGHMGRSHQHAGARPAIGRRSRSPSGHRAEPDPVQFTLGGGTVPRHPRRPTRHPRRQRAPKPRSGPLCWTGRRRLL